MPIAFFHKDIILLLVFIHKATDQHELKGEKEKKVYRGPMKFQTQEGNEDIYDVPEMIAHKLNNWKGWHCYAGVENLAIDFHGYMRRAWCGAGNVYIGNIMDDLTLPTTPIICEVSKCHCGFDMMCTKSKSHIKADIAL